MRPRPVLLAVLALLTAGPAAAQPPAKLLARLPLARKLTGGDLKEQAGMPLPDVLLLRARREFEVAVLETVAVPRLSGPRLAHLQKLYDRLPVSYRYTLKGLQVPILPKRTAHLTKVQRAARREAVDGWLQHMGLEHLAWVLHHADRPIADIHGIALDPDSRDISPVGMASFEKYWLSIERWRH